jgi:hypothetical protein
VLKSELLMKAFGLKRSQGAKYHLNHSHTAISWFKNAKAGIKALGYVS